MSHRHDGRDETAISIDTANGRRTFVAAGSGRDYALIVDASAQAQTTGAGIELLVDRDADGATVERFRLCEARQRDAG